MKLKEGLRIYFKTERWEGLTQRKEEGTTNSLKLKAGVTD